MKNLIFALLIAIIAVFVSGQIGGATIANISGVTAFFVSLFILNQSGPTGKMLKIILTGMSLLGLIFIVFLFWAVSNMKGH
jgi:hypothetical protein